MASNTTNTTTESPGSAFPTFLDLDSNDGRPTTSSSMATSVFTNAPPIPSSTGPAGEPGLPPSRPTSGALSRESSQRMTSSRAAAAPPLTRMGYGNFTRRDGEGGSQRPHSSQGPTHVPSLLAQGFVRPMSSQTLQSQRGQSVIPPKSSHRTPALEPSVDEDAEEDSVRGHRHRYSNASVVTARDGDTVAVDHDAPPLPTSRGLSTASSGGGHDAYAGPGSVASKNSVAPLNTSRQMAHNQRLEPPPKSPMSFRGSLGFGSRHSSKQDVNRRRSPMEHEKLASNPASPTISSNEKVASQKAAGNDRIGGTNYEYFAGNMIFFLSGRLMNTKAQPLNVATFVLTVLPAALFFGFEAKGLWHNVSPAIPIIFAYIFFVTVSSFLHAAFSDPGILPRNLHPHPPNPEAERDPLTVGPNNTEWIMVKTFSSGAQKHDLENNPNANGATTAMEVPTKYCKSCNIWRPPRAHHCRVCDACTETQDHHCVWLNNCVGRRNYRFFFAYVGFSTIMALLLIAFSAVQIAVDGNMHDMSFGQALNRTPENRVALAMLIYAILAIPYPGSLFGYHLFLIARGETTREYLNTHKFPVKDRHRPFNQASILRNWAAVLGRPRPPSYMRFKHPYAEGDVRFGHTLPLKVRKEKGKLDAVRSASRVNGMKQRFSVHKDGEFGASNMELKDLSGSAEGANGAAPPAAPSKRSRPGGTDATPR